MVEIAWTIFCMAPNLSCSGWNEGVGDQKFSGRLWQEMAPKTKPFKVMLNYLHNVHHPNVTFNTISVCAMGLLESPVIWLNQTKILSNNIKFSPVQNRSNFCCCNKSQSQTNFFQKLETNASVGEVVAQLVECSPINLLACASVGSNPVTATFCP